MPAAAPQGRDVEDTLGLRKHLWEAGKVRLARVAALANSKRSVSRLRQPQNDSVVNLPQEKSKCRAFREGTYLPGNPSPLEFPSSISPEKPRRHTGGNERSHRVQTAGENTGDMSIPTRPRSHRWPASPARQSPRGAQTGQSPRDLLTFPSLSPSHGYRRLTKRR